MKPAVAYLRTSTDEQALGLAAQRAAIEAWALREGATVASWFTDEGVSGGTPLEKCPGLSAALDALKPGMVLVVAKRDRLARDVLKSALVEYEAKRARATIVSTDGAGNGDGPEAALMRSMLAAFAAFERQLIGRRTKAALAVRKSKGLRISRFAPWGYRFEGDRVVPDEAKQALLARAKSMRSAGSSWREVEAATGESETTLARAMRQERRRLGAVAQPA